MRPAPRHLKLQWHVTERCNLRCTHCYQGALPRELTYGQLLAVLEQFEALLERSRPGSGERAPRGHVCLTGGEPFVRRDFFDLLEELARRRDRLSFSVLSNGTRIDAALARRLRQLRPAFVQVSIDGTEATHDRIRGRGNHQRAAAGLRALVAAGVPTQISFTAHKGNYREFPEVVRLARGLGVGRVWADRLIPEGAGRQLGGASLGPLEVRQFFSLMAVARAEAQRAWCSRTEVSMRRALQFLVDGGRPYRCSAGDTLLTVMANGDLVPCRRLPLLVGNVLKDGLEALYRQSPLLVALRDRARVSAGCERCPVAQACGGGLRCLAFAQTGSPFRADPGCWVAAADGGLTGRARQAGAGAGAGAGGHEAGVTSAVEIVSPQ